jgi:hypothetical protein
VVSLMAGVRPEEVGRSAGSRTWTWTATLPRLPCCARTGADQLPKPEELVANAYDFGEQLLASQRKFAEEVVKATSALRQGDCTGQQPPI